MILEKENLILFHLIAVKCQNLQMHSKATVH